MSRAQVWSRAGDPVVLFALLLVSLALRPQLSAIGPLLPQIQADLGVSHAVAGLLASVFVGCMGAFSLVAPAMARRNGLRRTIVAGVSIAGGAALLRAIVPGTAAVLLLTVPIGAAVGVAGVALPGVVRSLFTCTTALATGVHAFGINIGAAAAAALAVPLAAMIGGWRSTLALYAAMSLIFAAFWLAVTTPARRSQREPGVTAPAPLPLGSAAAWFLVVLFGLQGLCFYGLVAWLPDAYVERGWSDRAGGALVGLLILASVPASLAGPVLTRWLGSHLLVLAASSAALLGGLVGLATAPGLAWGFAALVGAALGGLFSLCLLLPIDLAETPAEVAPLVGMTLGLGYLLSAVAPLALGIVRDASGGYNSALWTLVGVASALACTILMGSAVVRRAAEPSYPARA